MSQNRYDVVILGGGLNGLVAAAYLARAGRSVLVAERRAALGGAVGTEELAPGFRVSSTYASAELFHPSILSDLKLAGHGLKLLPAPSATFLANGDGLHVDGGDPAAAIARVSEKDAAAFRRLDDFLGRITGALEPLMTRPLPELDPLGMGDVLELLNLGFRLRGLGKKEMPEALRYLPMPIKDVADDYFETEALKALVAAPALRASYLAPRSAGSAMMLLFQRPAWGPGLLRPPVFAEGGLGALSEAVAAAARSAGAEIRTECAVERIAIDGEGRAAGVVLASGEEVASRIVVSNADPRRTLLELADPSWLDPEDAFRVKNVRARGTVALVHLALGELPGFTGAPQGALAGRVQIGATLDEIERSFDPVKYGEVPERPTMEITVPSLTDPGLAPEGKHVLSAWVQYVPYHLASGSWDERRDELGDAVVAQIAEHAPGLAEKVEHRLVLTPRDLEERYGCTGGSLYHAEPAMDQSLFLRPMPGWYRYATPIENLYLCGPGTPPGGGVTGLPGKNAATQILADGKKK